MCSPFYSGFKALCWPVRLGRGLWLWVAESIKSYSTGQINLCRLNTLETIAIFLECKVEDLFDEET